MGQRRDPLPPDRTTGLIGARAVIWASNRPAPDTERGAKFFGVHARNGQIVGEKDTRPRWDAGSSNTIWVTFARVERYPDRMIVVTLEGNQVSALGSGKYVAA